MTDMEETPKRRWFRFTLRALLIIILLVSLPLAWLRAELRQAERELVATRALNELDCDVYYSAGEEPDGELLLTRFQPHRGLIESCFGHQFLNPVVAVTFSSHIGETELRALIPTLRSFSELKQLIFPIVPYVSNADLLRLQEDFPNCQVARLGYADPPYMRFIDDLPDQDSNYRHVGPPPPPAE
jgi:hypothetical protein